MKSRFTLLVADDDAVILELVRSILTGCGYSVDTCAEGQATLQLLLEKSYALAILDLDMPGRTGLEVAHELRRRGRDTPVLFISGNFTPENLRNCRELTRVECLEKPFNVGAFLEAVVRSLAPCGAPPQPPQPPAPGR